MMLSLDRVSARIVVHAPSLNEDESMTNDNNYSNGLCIGPDVTSAIAVDLK